MYNLDYQDISDRRGIYEKFNQRKIFLFQACAAIALNVKIFFMIGVVTLNFESKYPHCENLLKLNHEWRSQVKIYFFVNTESYKKKQKCDA